MQTMKSAKICPGKWIGTAIAAFAAALPAFADDCNLRTLAVTNPDGSLKVLYHGSNAWWNAYGEYAPFDGDTSTFIDPKRIYYPTWVGYELTAPRVLTRVRFEGND